LKPITDLLLACKFSTWVFPYGKTHVENLHASNKSVIGFNYVAVCLLFSSLFYLV